MAAKGYNTTLTREKLDGMFNRATIYKWMQNPNAKCKNVLEV